MQYSRHNRGYITILVLVFAGVFVVIISALTGYIFAQNKLQFAKENRDKALHIAEAGLNYYKWRLSHFENDLQDGTGGPGPYVHTYYDPEGGDIGTFSLDVDGNEQCGSIRSIDITSTGASAADPTLTRTVSATYARPSVSEYAYIINSNVWAGSDRVITGRYHSNYGIRMDGTNQSLVTSAVSSWTCTSSFGCSPDQVQNGIFGAGPNSNEWDFPVPQVDFAGISSDLSDMKTRAQSYGLYLASTSPYGYHLTFKNNGTVDVFRVDNVSSTNAWIYNPSSGQYEETAVYDTITSEAFLQTYTPSVSCALVLAEDRLWLDGVVSGKITVAAADVADPNNEVDIILNGNIDYVNPTGSTDGLTAIAERSILIPLNSPDNMTLSGIFIAQNGKFGREFFSTVTYPANAKRNSLTMRGTIVSNNREGTKWTCPPDPWCSGYGTRVNSYDSTQEINPPPLTPYTSQDYKFVLWREEAL